MLVITKVSEGHLLSEKENAPDESVVLPTFVFLKTTLAKGRYSSEWPSFTRPAMIFVCDKTAAWQTKKLSAEMINLLFM